MIPVAAQPEPRAFDKKVRKKGLTHLAQKGYALNELLPTNADIKPYWRDCLTDLHKAYDGVCAYLCIFLSASWEEAVLTTLLPSQQMLGMPMSGIIIDLPVQQ